jgi:hypothetical protein
MRWVRLDKTDMPAEVDLWRRVVDYVLGNLRRTKGPSLRSG